MRGACQAGRRCLASRPCVSPPGTSTRSTPACRPSWPGWRRPSPTSSASRRSRCVDEKFPREAFERLGYNVETHGQKTYNGVALLSKYPLEDVRRGLPGDDAGRRGRRSGPLHRGGDRGARARSGSAASTCPTAIRSGPRSSPTSWRWMDRLHAHAARPAGAGGAVRPVRRLQRHPRARGRREPRAPGSTTPCSSPRAAPPSGR